MHVTCSAATRDQLLWVPRGPIMIAVAAVTCRLSACRSARSWAISLLAASAAADRPNGVIRDAPTGISASPWQESNCPLIGNPDQRDLRTGHRPTASQFDRPGSVGAV